jgi:hypothetical protein
MMLPPLAWQAAQFSVKRAPDAMLGWAGVADSGEEAATVGGAIASHSNMTANMNSTRQPCSLRAKQIENTLLRVKIDSKSIAILKCLKRADTPTLADSGPRSYPNHDSLLEVMLRNIYINQSL